MNLDTVDLSLGFHLFTMAEVSFPGAASKKIQEFSIMVDKAGPVNDTEQALVSHVNEEQENARRIREQHEQWHRWWQGATLLEIHE